MRARTDAEAPRCGSALILALWALLFLSMLAVAVGAYVSANLSAAAELAGMCRGYCLARAGVATAIAEAAADTNEWDAFCEPWGEAGRERFVDVKMPSGRFSVGHVARQADGSTVTNAGLADEEGRIPVNAVTNAVGLELIRALLETSGGLERQDAQNVAACIADWVDDDSTPRDNGAESDYYAGLRPPYAPHNGPVARIEELLLVRGVSPVLLARIGGALTCFGSRPAVNVNTADYRVLLAAACASSETQRDTGQALASRILAWRAAGGVLRATEKGEVRKQIFPTDRLAASEVAEWMALEWLINHDMLAVQSRYLCGISTGMPEGNGSGLRWICFVYDRKKGRVCSWDESWKP